jgi:four helix bundle protein
MLLVVSVYELTRYFPGEERYGLVAQMRRAAVSIPSNIAEGAARQTKREFINFLHIAQGSLSELDTQLEISLTLGYSNHEQLVSIQSLLETVSKLLTGLIKSLNSNT